MTIDVFVASVVASVAATIVVFVAQWIYNGYCSRRNFKKFEGEYSGYSYHGEDSPSDKYNERYDNEAVVSITYISVNKLRIEHTQHDQTWSGTIYMKNKNVGDLTWKYTQDPLRIGSKEISFWDNGAEKIVYLNERFDKKYGRELLIKEDER